MDSTDRVKEFKLKMKNLGLLVDNELLLQVVDNGWRCLCVSTRRCPCALGLIDAQRADGKCECGLLSKAIV